MGRDRRIRGTCEGHKDEEEDSGNGDLHGGGGKEGRKEGGKKRERDPRV